MSAPGPDLIKDAEQRGRDAARLANLENHAKAVNGSLERMTGQITAFREESARENRELGKKLEQETSSLKTAIAGALTAITSVTAEKKGIISLQNRQVAFMAAVATVLYLVIEHVH